eukprot:464967_1
MDIVITKCDDGIQTKKFPYEYELLIFGFARNIETQLETRFIPPEILSICGLYYSAFILVKASWMKQKSPSTFYRTLSKFVKVLPQQSRTHIWEHCVSIKLPDGKKKVLKQTTNSKQIKRLIRDSIIVYCKYLDRSSPKLKNKEVEPYIEHMAQYIYDTYKLLEQDKFVTDKEYFSSIIQKCIEEGKKELVKLETLQNNLNKTGENDINWQPRRLHNRFISDNKAVCGCGANKDQECIIL